jgi:hypothetical protein
MRGWMRVLQQRTRRLAKQVVANGTQPQVFAIVRVLPIQPKTVRKDRVYVIRVITLVRLVHRMNAVQQVLIHKGANNKVDIIPPQLRWIFIYSANSVII